MKLLFLIKSVSTMGDECSPVEIDLGAISKRRAI